MKIFNKDILFDQFSKILNLKNNLIYSVPWIQPVKIDDKIINEYMFVLKFNFSNFTFNLFKSFYEILISFNKLIISVFIKSKKIDIDSNILILSHLINTHQLGSKNDFYFGNLEENLDKFGHKTSKYFLNHTNLNKKRLSNYKSYIFPKIDTFKIEFEVFYNQLKLFFFILLKIFYLIKNNQKISVIIIFLLKTLSYQTQSALRIGIQVKHLIKDTNIKFLFITFEGHCYEKIISLYNQDISIIAYQNTPLSFSQFSIKFYSNYTLPSVILTKNRFYKKFLENNLNFKTKILNFGDLNYKAISHISSQTKRSSSILFVPEGIESEVKIMINFIKKNYKINQDINFTIRFHPVFSKILINKYKYIFKDATNVFFSERTPQEDFSNNIYVIYRGSSLIFDAIRAGLIPIYLNKGININILDILELSNNIINFESNLNDLNLNNLNLETNTIEKFTNLFYPARFDNLLNEIH